LIRYAKGVDVIVHEVAAANEQAKQSSPLINQILGFHTSPEEAGKVFELTKPKLAVYSHIILLTADPTLLPPTMKEVVARTKKTYSGAVEAGEDLLSIEIGDKIKVLTSQQREKTPEVVK